jgi:hypothetical protein
MSDKQRAMQMAIMGAQQLQQKKNGEKIHFTTIGNNCRFLVFSLNLFSFIRWSSVR